MPEPSPRAFWQGEYANLKSIPGGGEIRSLPTIMMYSFYASQCIGAATNLAPPVQRCAKPAAAFFEPVEFFRR